MRMPTLSLYFVKPPFYNCCLWGKTWTSSKAYRQQQDSLREGIQIYLDSLGLGLDTPRPGPGHPPLRPGPGPPLGPGYLDTPGLGLDTPLRPGPGHPPQAWAWTPPGLGLDTPSGLGLGLDSLSSGPEHPLGLGLDIPQAWAWTLSWAWAWAWNPRAWSWAWTHPFGLGLDIPPGQNPPWTDRHLWKHNLRKLRLRTVIMVLADNSYGTFIIWNQNLIDKRNRKLFMEESEMCRLPTGWPPL